MKAKLLEKLNEKEIADYKRSDLYRKFVLSPYQYTDNSVRYYDEYFNHEYKNYSIIVFDDSDNPLIALYAFAKPALFSYFGLPVQVVEAAFTDNGSKYNAYKELIIRLREVLQANNFDQIKFYHNEFLSAEFFSSLLSNEIYYKSYVDLSLPEEQIRSNIRKSYKSLVNWGEKNLQMERIDSQNPDYEKFTSFRDFHVTTAGRKTRSDKSWDLQFDSIKDDEAYLILGYLEGKIVSGSLILYGKTEAYYGVGVYDRDLMFKNVAVGHYNMMASVFHAKKIGLNSMHLGYISSSTTDEKEKNIFKFKAGFSGTIDSLVHFSCNLSH